jgi:hypothetical protein
MTTASLTSFTRTRRVAPSGLRATSSVPVVWASGGIISRGISLCASGSTGP